jgi:hypothetical protein
MHCVYENLLPELILGNTSVICTAPENRILAQITIPDHNSKVDVAHRGHNHPKWITSASNCRNVPPMLTDGWQTLHDYKGSPRWANKENHTLHKNYFIFLWRKLYY